MPFDLHPSPLFPPKYAISSRIPLQSTLQLKALTLLFKYIEHTEQTINLDAPPGITCCLWPGIIAFRVAVRTSLFKTASVSSKHRNCRLGTFVKLGIYTW